MKAKYEHHAKYYNLDPYCTIYDQVICEDNIVVTVRTNNSSMYDNEPITDVTVCLTNAEARQIFFHICEKFEEEHYECVYKEA